MVQAKGILVESLSGYRPEFDGLVRGWIADRVGYVAVVGVDCEKLEEIVDEICVGDGSKPYMMLTTSHPDVTTQEAIGLIRQISEERPLEIIRF